MTLHIKVKVDFRDGFLHKEMPVNVIDRARPIEQGCDSIVIAKLHRSSRNHPDTESLGMNYHMSIYRC
jgi:hypothetical protein